MKGVKVVEIVNCYGTRNEMKVVNVETCRKRKFLWTTKIVTDNILAQYRGLCPQC